MSTRNREEQVLFAFCPADQTPDNVPVLVFMIPQAAWDYARNGMAHDFDLTKLGVPIKVVIGRTLNHETGMETLRKAGAVGAKTKDLRDADVSFRPGTKQ